MKTETKAAKDVSKKQALVVFSGKSERKINITTFV
jgi:hypothetical protein